MSLLEVQNVTYQIGEKKILDNLNLAIGSQEIHALIGANGSGKSTLAYIVMGCEGYYPNTGKIRFNDTDIGPLKIDERARLGIALAWQEPARFEGLLVDQYLTLQHPAGEPAVYLKAVGLSPEVYGSRSVDKSLSGGERKRIELASLLALKPQLAILDEPGSGIDMLSVQEIIDVIRAFKEGGASVLLITHQETFALIADRASQLCAGKVIASGDPKEVAEQYKKGRCIRCDGLTCLPETTSV
jgi:Fe-S cluster assembly ATP-binding protein